MIGTLRLANIDEADVLVALINAAYEKEAFFKIGDRTDAAEVTDRLENGCFLVADEAGDVVGCVYIAIHGERGYFGMLSVHPSRQGTALGRALIGAAEEHCRMAGCAEMELEVVNLREELIPWYGRLGYVQFATAPFPQPERASRDCHMLLMKKALSVEGSGT
ncbi:MAG: GNAT family N-acetyltransferase [Tepidiformaceae bacterium]